MAIGDHRFKDGKHIDDLLDLAQQNGLSDADGFAMIVELDALADGFRNANEESVDRFMDLATRGLLHEKGLIP